MDNRRSFFLGGGAGVMVIKTFFIICLILSNLFRKKFAGVEFCGGYNGVLLAGGIVELSCNNLFRENFAKKMFAKRLYFPSNIRNTKSIFVRKRSGKRLFSSHL